VTAGVKGLEHLVVPGPYKETAGDCAGIDSSVACVGLVDNQAGDMSTHIDRTHLNKIGVLRGTNITSNQSQDAYKQAEKYFVTFHKILIIN
jgi:hypothetical protein